MAAAEVVLVVDANGDVRAVTRRDTGEAVKYDIVSCETSPDELPASVVCSVYQRQMSASLRRALSDCALRGGAAKVVPLPHCVFDGRTARGAVHVFRPKSLPCETGWPLDLRYATGVSIVEIERTLPNASYLSAEMVRSREFSARLQAAIMQLHEERGTAPGLFLPGHPALDALRPMTAGPGDPLLRTYRPDFTRVWQPRLKTNDFVQVYMSTWDTVHPATRAVNGHGAQDVHFYFLVCWHLPEEISEQLMQLVRLNPERQTWAQLAARKEFERALEISVKAREDILRRLLDLTALEPKRSLKNRFAHTTTDVLVGGVETQLPGKDRPSGNCVAFYSGCAPTNRSPGGCLALTESSPSEPVFWWHGRHAEEHVGGHPFDMPETVHAVPTLGPALKFNKKLVALLGGAGLDIAANGYMRLQPIL